MTRKLQRAILKKEGQRRSPRISALETWQPHGSSRLGDPVLCSESKIAIASEYKKPELDNGQGQGQGPAFRTRGRNKRKLRPVQQVSASASLLCPPKQDGSQSDEEDIHKQIDEPSNLPSATLVPEKHMLELVLDILQRRDTYEIFAEPVDPKEVEDYYEIIEEPMDFGTMRAKLHEGMYKNLEQFEHDVYLIFSNAMHFNSSGTIYFRQARAINDLAKKVFEVLKANPENFESEFSERRQKILRRNHGDFASINVKSSGLTNGVSSKVMLCSFRSTSIRKNFKANHGRSNIAKHVDARKPEILSGIRDSRQHGSLEADRRSTYRPTLSFGEDESIFPTVHSKLKLLEHVNQQHIGYRDSLMFFVKDLGFTAQNIARRKLLGCEIRTAASPVSWGPETLNAVTTSMPQNPLIWFSGYSNSMRSPRERADVEITSEGKRAYANDDTYHAIVEGILNTDKKTAFSSFEGNMQNGQGMSFGYDEVYKNRSHSNHSISSAEELSCLVDAFEETGKNSMIMSLDKTKLVNQVQLSESALKHSQTDVFGSRWESKCMFQSQSWALQTRDISSSIQDKTQMEKPSFNGPRSDFETISVQNPSHEVSCSSEAGNISKSVQTLPLASSFIFNLSYLKTRLDQIKSSEHDRLSQLDSSCTKKPFSVQAKSLDP